MVSIELASDTAGKRSDDHCENDHECRVIKPCQSLHNSVPTLSILPGCRSPSDVVVAVDYHYHHNNNQKHHQHHHHHRQIVSTSKLSVSNSNKTTTTIAANTNSNNSCNLSFPLTDTVTDQHKCQHHQRHQQQQQNRQHVTPKSSSDSTPFSSSSFSSTSSLFNSLPGEEFGELEGNENLLSKSLPSSSAPTDRCLLSNSPKKPSTSISGKKFVSKLKRSFSEKRSQSTASKSVAFKLRPTRHISRMASFNVSMSDSINDSHHENTANDSHGTDLSDSAKCRSNPTSYKDRRKNYRLEKKKLAEELISAIQDPTTVVMSDWLKVRTTLKQWNKYFCELRPGSLYLYKNQKTNKSSNWIGTVMLKMCESIERPSKKNGFCFKLFHPLEHPIWSPKGPHGEAFTSIMFPLPMSSVIFRAPSEEAGRKWMEAIELSLRCSNLIINKHQSNRDSAPTTPLSANSNGSGIGLAHSSMLHGFSEALGSIDRSDDELLNGNPNHSISESRLVFNELDIEKHFDLDDEGHTDHGEHEDSQEHHSTDDSDDSFDEEYIDDGSELNDDVRRQTLTQKSALKDKKAGFESCIEETPYLFDGGNEEFGLVGDAGQTEEVPEENKSLLWTLLKQVRPGMDLSKVVLPTFILEPRSFLEKLTDYYYHCDIVSKAALEEDPLLRMKLILKWYLSGFYKKPKGLKKPYNPILGETFRCFWNHPETDSKTFYIAEQVSHHPPVSAFYVTNRKDGFCISGSILAKSKFYGNSISAILEGTARLTLLARGEDYLITFPYAHCKGIFLGPLAFELGGKVNITCEKTGYKTELEFKLKPFFGSEDQCNLVVGKLRLGNETLGTIDGHWDSQIWYKDKRKGESELFWSGIDPKVKESRLKRFVVPMEHQRETESEKLWHKVTLAIQKQDQNAATVEKTILEEAQREAAKLRESRMEAWNPDLFMIDNTVNDWRYKMAEVRPWDNRTDVKQYEHNYVVLTFTRHLTSKPLSLIKSSNNSNKKEITEQNLFDERKHQLSSGVESNGSEGGGGGGGSILKRRFRRQHTCPDSTVSYSGRDNCHLANNVGAKVRADNSATTHELTTSQLNMVGGSGKHLGRNLDQMNTLLSSIKTTLDTVQREQNHLKSEINNIHSTLRQYPLPPSSSSSLTSASQSLSGQHYIVNTQPTTSSTFKITKDRFKHLLLRIPTEVRLVMVVLITHLFVNCITSVLSSYTNTAATTTTTDNSSISTSSSIESPLPPSPNDSKNFL